MLMQWHPARMVNVHDSPLSQKPLHSGELASPHEVVRHSHEPPEVTAEQCPPLPQLPSQRRSSLLNEHAPSVVDVVVTTVAAPPRVAGAQRNCPALKRTTRLPLS